MCLPAMVLIPLAISAASAAVGYMGAGQEAKAQNAYWEENRQASITAMTDRYASLGYKTQQEYEAASEELLQKRIEATKTRATAQVAADSGGVTGLSIDSLLTDIVAQQGRQEEAIQTNFENQRFTNQAEAEATQNNTIGRINSVRKAAKPSPLAYVIKGISGGITKDTFSGS